MKTKEIIVGKTSVWKTICIIKKDSIIHDRYINLSKLKYLHIHNVSKLFRKLRKKLEVSQRKCAEILNLSNVSNYENSNQAPPFNKLLDLSNLVNFDLYQHINKNKYEFSFGTRNEKPIDIPLDINKAIKISSTVKPSKLKVRNILYIMDKNSNLKYNLKIHLNKDGNKIIYSAVLWNYLNTFFAYRKLSLIKFPLSEIYDDLKTKGVSNTTIIGSLLITEGSKNKKGFDFSNKSKILHNILVEAIYDEYKVLPTSYFLFVGDVYRTFFSTQKIIFIRNRIEKLFGNIQTKPNNNLKKYLDLDQPSLKNIKNKCDKIALIRIFSVTEGGIHFNLVPYNRRKEEFIASPYVYITCSHPKILLDLYNILISLKFHPTLRKDKTWSGWAGIILPSFGDSITFLKNGGFLEDVKVARTDAIFYNIDKQVLFLSIFELRKRMLNDRTLRNLRKKDLVKELFEIINNEGYQKDINSYLNLLKPIHNKRKLKTSRINELKRDVQLLLNNSEEFYKTRN